MATPAALDPPRPAAAGLTFEGVQDAFNDRVIQFTNYLDRDFKENDDHARIKDMVKNGRQRLIVEMDDLRSYDRQLAENLLANPMDHLPAFDRALKDVVLANYHPGAARLLQETAYYIGLQGSFGDYHVTPRTLHAGNLGHMVALEGIVTRCSLVRPKMLKSVHYCEKTHLFTTREYRDATMLGDAIPTGTAYPTQDEAGNPLTTEFGYCTFRDHQLVAIQEMPERAPPGLLPRSIDVMLDDDLVDACKPGDRVQMVGVYRAVGGGSAGSATGTFRTVLLANNVRHLDKEIAQPTLTDVDLQNIRRLAKRGDIFDLLARSLAPSIYGHEWVKKAVLLQLLGGLEHNLDNGTHIRGDINILLLGDPSTAKSQFLRFVLHIAPLAIATTGRGSSGVGLTAAVTQDRETGERRLEAGAMVLADRGVVCIDEFDKMSDADRVAIHEVMEQQTITIAKAGIHTSLNARCSVIAAANPTYGQYDEHLEPHRNIRLPDSLLSRFDLLFVILDKTDEPTDRHLAGHVLRMHRYLPPGVEEGQPLPATADDQYQFLDDAPKDVPVFEKTQASQQPSASGSSTRSMRTRRGGNKGEVLSMGFLKKFIHYAKSRIKPTLTPDACETITEAYTRFRNEKANEQNQRRTLPITARTLETLIRLATAHAKTRLSRTVDVDDANAAAEILEYALFKEFRRKKRTPANPNKRRKTEADGSGSDSDDEGGDGGAPAGAAVPPAAMAPAVGSSQPATQLTDSQSQQLLTDPPSQTIGLSALLDDDDEDDGMDVDQPAPGAVFDQARYAQFKVLLDRVFQETNGQAAAGDLPALVNGVSARTGVAYTRAETDMYVASVEEEQGVFVDHDAGVVYRV
ncbi:MCM DNA helicase complex subunit [Allomyces arbusculus]|nr:MCM DNA helicase complex subunit [Allomyces arbusculus]